MSSILDRIPPLPEMTVTSTEAFNCPWCRSAHDGDHLVDEEGGAHVDLYACDCGGVFRVEPGCESGDLVAIGVRSETDLKYMAAMGVTEADVHRHHFPEAC